MKTEPISKRLVASYVLDWLVIIIIAAIGAGLNFVSPKKRAFSLLNLDISFPLVEESISTSTLGLVAFLAPAVLISAICLLLVPARSVARALPRAQATRLKLWELHQGLAGLALSVATAFFVTQALKNLFGKPRPDLLARCVPNLDDLAAHVVGTNYGQQFDPRWVLVDVGICTQTDAGVLHDGFRSFPSGHSSWSWSGLLYLSLFLCSKFAVAIPFLPFSNLRQNALLAGSAASEAHEMVSLHDGRLHDSSNGNGSKDSCRSDKPPFPATSEHEPALEALRIRNVAASPPNHLIIVAFLPIAVALYIVSTRYAEYYHFGFDIISGSLIGMLAAAFAFRWYHLPLARGQGWAWGARSRERAFAAGVGAGGYVDAESWSASTSNTGTQHGGAGGTASGRHEQIRSSDDAV